MQTGATLVVAGRAGRDQNLKVVFSTGENGQTTVNQGLWDPREA